MGALLVSCAFAWAAGPARAESAPAEQPEMSQEMLAKIEAAQQLMTPGEAHKVFEPLAGTWTYTGQMWMGPDAPAEPMTGTSTNTLLFGGRFLRQEVAGQIPDMPPFEGVGLLGYDNIRKEYQSNWYDNMNTAQMASTGTYDAATKTLTLQGDFSCPMTGEAHRPMRDTWMLTDATHSTYTSYSTAPDGREYKAMEIRYTRQP
jgi:hypothetical protein